jgi:hypothetical protein
VPARRGRGKVGRSRPSSKEATAVGAEEAQAQPGHGERGARV